MKHSDKYLTMRKLQLLSGIEPIHRDESNLTNLTHLLHNILCVVYMLWLLPTELLEYLCSMVWEFYGPRVLWSESSIVQKFYGLRAFCDTTTHRFKVQQTLCVEIAGRINRNYHNYYKTFTFCLVSLCWKLSPLAKWVSRHDFRNNDLIMLHVSAVLYAIYIL